MNAVVTGETDDLIGLSVIDNSGVEHVIDIVKETGEVTAHNQEGYPDESSKRTDEGNINVYQASNYAQYYVWRTRGHDTVKRHRTPDFLILTTAVVAGLSVDDFQRHFGGLYRQLRSHDTDADPVVKVHHALEDAHLLYAQELYLDLDDGTVGRFLDAVPDGALRAITDAVGGGLTDAGPLDHFEAFGADHEFDALARTGIDPADLVEAVSGVCPQWRVGHEIHREDNDIPDVDREPDARVEIVQYTPESIEAFREYVVHHLTCQVRDSFVAMGVVPPAPFRVLGPGTDYLTGKQQVFDDALQPYHDPGADVDWTEV